MVLFLIVLLGLGILLEVVTLCSGLKKIGFSYTPSTDRTEPDEPLSLNITLVNYSLLPVTYLRSRITCPMHIELSEGVEVYPGRFSTTVYADYRLWGKQKLRRSIGLTLQKRGVHVFRDTELLRGDFLAFKTMQELYPAYHEVLVYPTALDSAPLKEALGTYCGDTIARRHLIRDPIITMGVREYSGREPMKTISWSQSARRGELMVREFDYTRDLSCTVLFTTNGIDPTDDDTLDRCCSMARTVCQELVDHGVNVEFYTNAPLWGYSHKGVWSCSATPGNMDDLLQTLARIFAAYRCTTRELAGLCAQTAERATAFVLIAASSTPDVRDAMQVLHDSTGLEALLLLADDPDWQ